LAQQQREARYVRLSFYDASDKRLYFLLSMLLIYAAYFAYSVLPRAIYAPEVPAMLLCLRC